MYRKDFESIDKDGDGGISYGELLRWFKQKNEHEGGSWKVFLVSPEVIQYAHVQSSRVYRSHDPTVQHKVIGIDDFRTFLIHFFAISILWIHFKNADDCQFTDDFGNMKLSFDEFKLAVNTLTATRGREELGDEQLKKDFATLDVDNSGSLGFAEVHITTMQALFSCLELTVLVFHAIFCFNRCALTAASTLMQTMDRI